MSAGHGCFSNHIPGSESDLQTSAATLRVAAGRDLINESQQRLTLTRKERDGKSQKRRASPAFNGALKRQSREGARDKHAALLMQAGKK